MEKPITIENWIAFAVGRGWDKDAANIVSSDVADFALNSCAAVSTPRCPIEHELDNLAKHIAAAVMNPSDFKDREGREDTIRRVREQLDQFFQPAPSAPQSFLPMSTAPKDGTEVLLRVKMRAGVPGKCLVGHWMPGGHCIEDHPPIDEGWYFWNGRIFDKAAEPIGWKPIEDAPAPPQALLRKLVSSKEPNGYPLWFNRAVHYCETCDTEDLCNFHHSLVQREFADCDKYVDEFLASLADAPAPQGESK